MRKMSTAGLKIRRDKGLCYNCDEKYHPDHKCKPQFLLLLARGDGDEYYLEEDAGLSTAKLEAVTDVPEVSLNALAGQFSLNTLRVTGRHNSQLIHVLIDNGSTHNFEQPEVAERLKLIMTPTKPFKGYIGNGQSLWCKFKCIGVNLLLQGYPFVIRLCVLDIHGADMVLGIQWLSLLGHVVSDYKDMAMSFT
ncbi:RVP_2 domain-containing protein [Cephalotus follicularis]|uniref:RVP_2 domain-containing protein n=1 Tax=Cephalotus follicularis TaxID=3775 RepID=A0A1Q3DFM3_CEPFO|nr:RVP_2 domain-containing protein [Cephalotus follicularis]